jgi:hypothetical protein
LSNPFRSGDDYPLLEPFGSLFQFLGKVHSELGDRIAATSNPSALVVLEHVKRSVEAAGVIVKEMGG